MLKLFNVNFDSMPERKLDEIFTLRKITFKDRLDWKVTCTDGRESDQYDDENTNYILGIIEDTNKYIIFEGKKPAKLYKFNKKKSKNVL